MSRVRGRDGDIAYEAAGSGSPSLLLLHGWGADARSMAGLAARLAARHRVANVDLRGYGASDGGTEPYGTSDVTEDLATVAADAGLGRTVLVGHSLGAKLVLAAANERPTLASAVVLLDTSIRETEARRSARRAEVAAGTDDPGFRARIEGMFLVDDRSPERAETLAAMAATPRAVLAASLGAGDAVDTAAALRDCPVPVMYVGATSPREDEAVMRELRPDLVYGRVVVSGHFVQYEGLPQTVAMIERFLEACVPAEGPPSGTLGNQSQVLSNL